MFSGVLIDFDSRKALNLLDVVELSTVPISLFFCYGWELEADMSSTAVILMLSKVMHVDIRLTSEMS